MPDTSKPPLIARVSTALAVLRGRGVDTPAEARAVTPTTMPNMGMAGLSLVRTANPQEYKPEGATIRSQGFNAHPVVHACIRVIADIVASVPLVVLQERGNNESKVGENHPLQRLLDYPGPRMTARAMRARSAVDFLGYGNSFFQMDRPAPGRPPLALRAVNAESIQSVWVDEEGDPRRYDYGNWSGVIVSVGAEDMLHFRDLDMPRPYYPDVFGFPRGATAILSIAADNEATKYVRQVVNNDGTPTFAVMLSDEATSDDAQAMQDRYRARVVDRGKRGTPAFFGAVKDIKPLGFTLRDLEFPDLRRVSREDICAAFGVDPRMIGIASATSDAGLSGAQYAEARARLVQHTIEPLMAAVEDELNHWLAPEFGDVWVSYDHDTLRDLVENDKETSERVRLEFAATLRTWEESRRALKLPPLPEPTDTLAMTMGTTLVPAATAVIDPRAVMDEAPATDNETPADGEGPAVSEDDMADMEAEEDTEAATNTRATRRMLVRAVADQALTGDQIEALTELLEAIVEKELPPETVQAVILAAFPKLDAALVAAMVQSAAAFEPPPEEDEGEAPEAPEAPEEMAADVLEPLTQNPGIVSVDAAPQHWWQRLTQEELEQEPRYQYWKRAMDELTRREAPFHAKAMTRFAAERSGVGQMFGVSKRAFKTSDEIIAEIERRIRDEYAPGGDYYEAWKKAYTDLIGEMYMVGAKQVGGVGLSFSLQSPEVLRAIDARAARLAELVGETTSTNILAAIRAAQVAGLSVAETGRLVQATVFNERITDARAMTIARTESAGAMSQGNWDQAKQMGDLYQSKEWLAFEDDRTRMTHLFCMAEGRIPMDAEFSNGCQFPLDPNGDAAEVINCRCVLAVYDTPAED